MEKDSNIHSFLSLGYFMDFSNSETSYDFTCIPELKDQLSELDKADLFYECKNRWYNVFQRLYTEGNHLVPISGGLDSRAVLATLLEFIEADRISTYTFGTPGSYDYEIGRSIAAKVGTKHKQFSFEQYEFSIEKEIEVSQLTSHQTFLFHHPPLDIIQELYPDHFIWSGFMLDWIAGSHMPIVKTNNIEIAIANNLERDRFVKSIRISDEHKINYEVTSFIDSSYLSYEEQVEGLNRYPKYIAPNILYRNQEFKLPGYDTELSSFFFSLKDSLRKNENFYIEFLQREFRDLFLLPVKSNSGLPLDCNSLQLASRRIQNKLFSIGKRIFPSFAHPHTNYMDFEEGIRRRKDLNYIIETTIRDLGNRKIVDWIDLENLYSNHMNRKGNHADALLVLASLELHLKAGKKL